MKHFHLHPEDSSRLRRWLKSNLGFCAIVALLLIAVRFQPSMPASDAVPPTVTASQDAGQNFVSDSEDDSQPRAVMPEGWRRTVDGWEHVSTWSNGGKDINELIETQKETEPAWAQALFAKIRSVSPLMLALMQVTLIATIVNVANARRDGSESVK